ncbi:hypothetical protein AB0L65_61070 [Nonomuraea sp. NPDC052116]|uniref:hypothetical protein n=1 Tax=Nonomuraea sp. NPDC052116 TaxID=3155665 RepID=UPI00344AD975
MAASQSYHVTIVGGGSRGLRAAPGRLRLVWAFSPRVTSAAWLPSITIMTMYHVALDRITGPSGDTVTAST